MDSVLLDSMPADRIADLAADLRRAFDGRPVRLYIDDTRLESRLSPALGQAGIVRRNTMLYLAHDGTPVPTATPDFRSEAVQTANLAAYAVTAAKAFSDSEANPAPQALAADIASLQADLHDGHVFRLAWMAGEAAAVIGWHEGTDRLVFHLATRLPYRRRGIARHLLGRAVAETYALKKRSITVCTDANDGPLSFYRRLGFTVEVYRQARYLYRPTA